MDKNKKILLSIVGVSAVIVPAILLVTLTSRPQSEPAVSSEGRPIDAQNLDEAKKALPSPSPVSLPSPSPSPSPDASPTPEATPEASPSE